jgi:acyl-homoserine-lactone acylase
MRDQWSVVFAPLACLLGLILIGSGSKLLSAPPIAERVEIRRDTFGVPHILANDVEAAGYGFGYAMAEDHAASIGQRYLLARGEAARHLGDVRLGPNLPSVQESDLAMQRLDNRAAARKAFREETGTDFRRWLEGFAAGVNQYVTTHREKVPPWMPVVEPWDPLAMSRVASGRAALQPPSLLLQKYGTRASDAGMPVGESGSNALALAGTRTTSGRPILLGNPHLNWNLLYWEAHVTIPRRLNFYGSTLVGIPVLRAGFNDHLGYVQTDNAPDLQDIYALPLVPGQSEMFLHDGRTRRINRREVTVDVRRNDGTIETIRREYEETSFGPVIHRTADRVFVVRSMHLDWWRDFEAMFDLQHARSVREFRRVLGRHHLVMSNYTYADVDGNILYEWNARLPRRPDPAIDYSLDVPGDQSRLFWKGVHRGDLPSLLNPSSGYVQNANNPPWLTSLRDHIDPSRFPSYVERGPLALRAQLALGSLDNARKFSPDDVRELKFTTRVLAAERLVPELLAAARNVASPSEPLRAAIETLDAWDRRVSAGSRGAMLFERFMFVYGRFPAAWAVAWNEREPITTPRGLADPAAALTALERAAGEVRKEFGSERVAWGDVNRFRVGDIDLPADGAAGAMGVYRVMQFDSKPDGRRVAWNLGPSEQLAGFGDAWVLMVHFTEPITAWSVLAYGQTTNLASPHSRDQIRLFANHQLRPVWFSEAAIAANLESRYRPER